MHRSMCPVRGGGRTLSASVQAAAAAFLGDSLVISGKERCCEEVGSDGTDRQRSGGHERSFVQWKKWFEEWRTENRRGRARDFFSLHSLVHRSSCHSLTTLGTDMTLVLATSLLLTPFAAHHPLTLQI
jgi:hypothetical protein